jgi:hypothetical protein
LAGSMLPSEPEAVAVTGCTATPGLLMSTGRGGMVTGVALGSLSGALVRSPAGGGVVLKPESGAVEAAAPVLLDAEEDLLSPLPPPHAGRSAMTLHTKTHETKPGLGKRLRVAAKFILLMGTSHIQRDGVYCRNIRDAKIHKWRLICNHLFDLCKQLHLIDSGAFESTRASLRVFIRTFD